MNATVNPTGFVSIANLRNCKLRQRTGISWYQAIVFLLLLGQGLPNTVLASVPTGHICDHAARVAASESKVPLSVLRSITRTETGRTRAGSLQPWPWTVNMEGVGKWFETEDAARAYVFKHFKRGARSFDVGCFQINYRWHGEAFRSIDEMFDPLENARYAAAFLSRLHSETNDWSKAAGAYHSRTPKFAKTYRARFDRIRQTMDHTPIPATSQSVSYDGDDNTLARINRYPLLQQVAHDASYGSLVPLDQAGGNPIGRGTGNALILMDADRRGLTQ